MLAEVALSLPPPRRAGAGSAGGAGGAGGAGEEEGEVQHGVFLTLCAPATIQSRAGAGQPMRHARRPAFPPSRRAALRWLAGAARRPGFSGRARTSCEVH